MKKVSQELENWVNEFKDVAYYHSGDYKEGMLRVLEGLERQIPYYKNLENE